MSPRKPAVLRDGDGQNLRDHLIATAARLIGERGTAGLGVRDIAMPATPNKLWRMIHEKQAAPPPRS